MKPTRYIDIFETLEERIRSGTYPVGSKLPTEDELSKMFGVNRHTIRRSLKLLLERGYIERKPRLGSVVVSSKPLKRVFDGVLIKYTVFSSGHAASDEKRLAVLNEVCADFNRKHPGISVEPKVIDRVGSIFAPRLPLSDPSGAVIISAVDYVAEYSSHGIFENLDAFFDDSSLFEDLPGMLLHRAPSPDGSKHIFALPIRLAAWMSLANMGLFKKLGFSESDLPSTMDELLSISAAIAEKGAEEGIYPFEPLLLYEGQQSITRFLPYIHHGGAGMFPNADESLELNQPALKNFMTWLKAMYEHAPKNYPERPLFREGKAVFRLSVTAGFVDEFEKTMDGVKVFPIPLVDADAEPRTVVNATYAGIIAGTADTPAKREAAGTFLRHLLSPEIQKLMFARLSDLPLSFEAIEKARKAGGNPRAFLDFALNHGEKAYDLPCNNAVQRIILRAFQKALADYDLNDILEDTRFMLDGHAPAMNPKQSAPHPELEVL